jgi:hypothetical protein
MNRSHIRITLAVCVVLLIPVSLYAQAWVSPKGTGSISISYLNNLDNRDYFGHGEPFIDIPPNPMCPSGCRLDNFGELRTQGVYFDFAYSFTDKLGLTVSIPYLAPKYTAPTDLTSAFFAAHAFPDNSIPLDDGKYHGSFADFGFRLRYNVASAPFLITPFIEYNQPSHDYLFYSHAIVGRNVKSFSLGTYVGGTIDRLIPNAYMQGRYSLSFDEKVLDISRKRSIGEFEFGYFIKPEIRAFTILAAQITHGGVDAPYDLGEPDPNNPLFFHHTQITRDNYLNLSLGGQYSINDRVDFFGVVTHMLTARNLHGLDYSLTFGFSWGFGGSPQRPCHC